MTFGDTLRNLRIKRGLTQMELARYLETSQAAITAWEHNKRDPDYKSIQKISNYFNVPIAELMGDQGKINPYVQIISESLEKNHKLIQLFSMCRFMSDNDLDILIGVVAAMTRGVRHNELPKV